MVNLDSYKLMREYNSSNPIDEMMREKQMQVKALYDMAVDRENGCLIENREFVKSPRVFDRKIKTNYWQSLTLETIEKEDRFLSGNLLFYDNDYWICTSSFVFHNLYCKGNFIKANYTLKWQNDKGEIIQSKCFVQSAAQYNSGEDGNKNMTLTSDQVMIVLPSNDETNILDRTKRFYVSKNSRNPSSYKLTRNDTIPYSDWDCGCVNLVLTECAENHDTDRPDLGICDYISPTDPVEPDEGKSDILCDITGKSFEIKIGKSREYTATLQHSNGDLINDIIGLWSIAGDSSDRIQIKAIDNKVTVLIPDDDSLIGAHLSLIYTLPSGEKYNTTLKIIGIWG